MTLYIITIGIILVSAAFTQKKGNNKLFWILVIMLAYISAVRFKVGTDYMGYVRRFAAIKNGGDSGFEVGILLLARLIIALGGNVQVWFMVTSVVINAAFGYTIVKNVDKKYRIFVLFVYVCSTVYFATMNTVRQYFAIAILLFGFEWLKKKNYLIYVLFIVLASLFHTSAVFMLIYVVMVFIDDRKNVSILKALNIAVMISVVLMFLDVRPYVEMFINYIPARYTYYFLNENFREKFFETRNALAIFKCIVPTLIWFYIYGKRHMISEKYKHFNLFMIGWAIYVTISNAFYGVNIFIRVYMLYEYFILYLIPIVIDSFKLKSNKTIIVIGIAVYYIALTSYAIFYKNGCGVIPYDTIFGKQLF